MAVTNFTNTVGDGDISNAGNWSNGLPSSTKGAVFNEANYSNPLGGITAGNSDTWQSLSIDNGGLTDIAVALSLIHITGDITLAGNVGALGIGQLDGTVIGHGHDEWFFGILNGTVALSNGAGVCTVNGGSGTVTCDDADVGLNVGASFTGTIIADGVATDLQGSALSVFVLLQFTGGGTLTNYTQTALASPGLTAVMADDMARVFLNDFAEEIVYRPSGGTARVISAIVDRDPPQLDGQVARPKMRITVQNDATLGIYSSDLDTGADTVTVAYRKGGTPANYRIRRSLDPSSEDSASISLELE